MSTSRSLNKVILIGNLTRNPVIRSTTNGSVVCSFGVATNSTWKDSKGNIQERTEFHNVIAWNKLGEICAAILATGMLVYIEGELRTRTWDDANGIRHFKTEIKLEDMKLLDDKGKKGLGVDAAKTTGDTIPGDDVDAAEVASEAPVARDSQPRETQVPAPAKRVEVKDEATNSGEGEELF